MNRTVKKIIANILIVVILMGSMPLETFAQAINSPEVTTVENEFVRVTVDNTSGRFSIRTVDGQPIRKKDGNVDMIFQGENPETSFTTFKIDGTEYIFGNPYKFAVDWFSEISIPKVVKNNNGTVDVITVWTIKGIKISQIITLITIDDKENAGNVRISYKVENNTKSTVEVGTRILLDTSVGGNDGPAFQIGQNYLQPLYVERKLVHEPEELGYNKETQEQEYNLHKLPPYWVMRDKLDLSNPLATNVMAYGFNNLFEGGINIVDEMIVGHWNGLANTKWEYNADENLDYTQDTNKYGTADTAVAYYWQPDSVVAGASKTYETVYGLGEIVAPDKVFDVRFMDTVQKLETTEDEKAYKEDGIFEINAEIENLAMFDMEHSKITVTCKLENGLVFVDEQGKELGGSTQTLEFKKEISPEEAAQGVEVITYKPGDIVAAKWKVKAKGRPWPVTRQYMVTVSSPETEKTLKNKLDSAGQDQAAEIRAIYESSKANFVFLPPVGELRSTLVYGLSPGEVYYSDDKYISANISNIEAYDVGNKSQNTTPNFDLYIKNVKTGERYKVPVTDAVTTQALGDGFAGDLRIVYKGGEKVDENGNTIELLSNGELPLGEYALSIDFKDKSDPEVAEALSFETEQTFSVTENEETRVRKAKILAVYKKVLDLQPAITSDETSEAMEEFGEVLPEAYGDLNAAEFVAKKAADRLKVAAAKTAIAAASKLLDPEIDIAEAMNDSAVPVYGIKSFESEEEFEDFKEEFGSEEEEPGYIGTEDEDEDGPSDEILLEIRGMIVQSGEGDGAQYTVNTDTEPAIINSSVAYSGKEMTFAKGRFPLASVVGLGSDTPFLDALFVKGDGTLSVANSGFVFHKGEWTLDFYNSFDKTLGEGYKVPTTEMEWQKGENPEDDTLNGSLQWASGMLGDALNPFRTIMITEVYFNRQSLFAPPSFSVNGFGLKFNDFILKDGGISFGGAIYLKIINGEVKNVIFNDEGFVGIDAALKLELKEDFGMLASQQSKGKDENGDDIEGDTGDVGGEITVIHYVDPEKYGVENTYGINFEADLKNIAAVSCELSFKQVKDGRILPDVVAFGAELPDPGVTISAATYLTGIRAAIRELADTIAGGGDGVPLTIEAGVDLKFGVSPASFIGSIDLTLKRTGMKIVGTMDMGEDNDSAVTMLTQAIIQTQWVTPWFVRANATIDVCGWDLIIGKASLFIGQNLEKNRIDFEGMISAKIRVPGSVPIIGGMNLASICVGANNDKLWGSVAILFFDIGITYYWGGGVEFGTNGEVLNKDALMYLLVDNLEKGPQVMALGSGINVLATSWENEEVKEQEVQYLSVDKGIDYIDDGSQNLGIGGITTSNNSKVHSIPMSGVSGNALIEVEYFDTKTPKVSLTKADGSSYDIRIGNVTDKNATAFEQIIKAEKEGDIESDGTRVSKQEAAVSTDIRRLYIAVPKEQIAGGRWTLTSDQQVRTKLMNIPVMSKISDVTISSDTEDQNKFTAGWTVNNAQAGDKINLYLSKDKVPEVPNSDIDVDPGLLIAKDIVVKAEDIESDGSASGHTDFDIKNVEYLGGADIRGLLAQGDYYLRAELKNDISFSAKSSQEAFKLIDTLAPNDVDAVELKAAGNGLFQIAFKPVGKKAGQENYQYNYVISAKDASGNVYEPLGEIMYTQDQLKNNLSDGKYQLNVGGWNKVGKPKMDSNGKIMKDAKGNILMENVQDKYTGIETGKEYSLGVTAVSVPVKVDDANQNMHFAQTVYSSKKLLPVPSKPQLKINGSGLPNNRYDLTVNQKTQEISVASNQSDVVVEAVCGDESLGSVSLNGSGNSGKLRFTRFDTDGTYAIELKARNTVTGDYSVSMLYLKVDTAAPMIYLNTPEPGAKIRDGAIFVKGMTNNDATIFVIDADNGTVLATIIPDKKGQFEKVVAVNGTAYHRKLRIDAKDSAGNANSALVEIINGDVKLPAKLHLTLPDEIKTGEQATILGATVEYSDGSTKPADSSKLTYSITMGGSNAKIKSGKLTALRKGAAIVEASYEAWEGLTLQDTDVVTIAAGKLSPPDSMGTIKAASVGTGNAGETRIAVQSYGNNENMTGCELAYRVYTDEEQAALPIFDQDITSWKALPASGIIPAKTGNIVVVAKRTTDEDKLVVASSSKIKAYEYVRPNTETNNQNSSLNISGVYVGSYANETGIVLPLIVDGQKKDNLVTADIKTDKDLVDVTVRLDKEAVLENLSALQNTIKLPVQGTLNKLNFELDAELVKIFGEKNVNIEVETDMGSYLIPASQIKTADMAQKFGDMDLKDIKVSITVAKPEEKFVNIAEKHQANKEFKIVSQPVEFSITCSGGGKTYGIEVFDSYVTKLIPAPEGVTSNKITTAVVIEPNGTIRHIPTKIIIREGRYYAEINSLTNSVYTLIYSSKSFKDTKGHWAGDAISDMASRLIVSGGGDGTFKPNSDITRAEFAAIIVMALGLKLPEESEGVFTDVPKKAWYNNSIFVANKYGLIGGYGNGKFGPSDKITREQATVIIAKAMKLAGMNTGINDDELNSILADFGDSGKASAWAKKSMGLCVKTEILSGQSAKMLAPDKKITRAEAAVLVRKLLQKSGLIE